MTNRHVLITVISILFAVFVIISISRGVLDNRESYLDDSNFNQIGNLTYNTPGMKLDTWFLVYDAPGAPALYKELEFDSASACAINEPAAPCDLSKLEAGARVRVEGRIVEEVVLVRTIQRPEVITNENLTPTGATPATGTPVSSTSTTPGTTTGATSTTSTTTATTSSPGTDTRNELTVKLYFYNSKLDDAQCSREGLVAVNRTIPRTNTPLQDTIKLLLRGELTEAEKEQGLTTEFPLSRVTLLSASNNDGTLTLTFRDPKNRTSGGSCRVSVMWSEIEATAKQFPGVNSVRFFPETLFQP